MKATSTSRDDHLPFLFALSLGILLFAGYRSCLNEGNLRGNLREPSMGTPKGPAGGGGAGIAAIPLSRAPKYVRQLIRHLKNTKGYHPPKGYRGGRVFRNREGTLPKGKTYYEFDVHPYRHEVSRGAERLIVDQEKNVFYYTKDHYHTFVKIQ